MKTILTFVLVFAAMLLSGCGTNQTFQKDENSNTRNLETPPYQIMKKSQVPADPLEYSKGKKETLIYHSDDADEYAAFAKEYTKLTAEDAPAFEGTVIIAKMGTKSTGGYGFLVQELNDNGRYTQVTLSIQKPSQFATMALTNPYIIILLPDNHKEIKVVEV